MSLLYPFTWPHVYIPMLPEDFLAFLKAPTVFIIGTHRSLLLQIGDDLEDDILVVDINTGAVQYGFKQQDHFTNNSSMESFIGNSGDSLISLEANGNGNGSDGNSNGYDGDVNEEKVSSSHWASSQNVELPRHETQKLIRFLTPVSNLLYGAHQHDFHQLDLAFPVAPTPDMIEKQEQLQAQRLKKMQSHSSALNLGQSAHSAMARKPSDSQSRSTTLVSESDSYADNYSEWSTSNASSKSKSGVFSEIYFLF